LTRKKCREKEEGFQEAGERLEQAGGAVRQGKKKNWYHWENHKKEAGQGRKGSVGNVLD